MPQTSDYAYVAGLLDGEGSIGIINRISHTKPGWKNRNSYTLSVKIYSNTKEIIDWLKLDFGGNVTQRNARSAKHASASYMIAWYNKQAEKMLWNMIRHLRIKKSHARIALMFQEYKSFSRPGRRGHSLEFLDKLHWFKKEIANLNLKGPNKPNAFEFA